MNLQLGWWNSLSNMNECCHVCKIVKDSFNNYPSYICVSIYTVPVEMNLYHLLWIFNQMSQRGVCSGYQHDECPPFCCNDILGQLLFTNYLGILPHGLAIPRNHRTVKFNFPAKSDRQWFSIDKSHKSQSSTKTETKRKNIFANLTFRQIYW